MKLQKTSNTITTHEVVLRKKDIVELLISAAHLNLAGKAVEIRDANGMHVQGEETICVVRWEE